MFKFFDGPKLNKTHRWEQQYLLNKSKKCNLFKNTNYYYVNLFQGQVFQQSWKTESECVIWIPNPLGLRAYFGWVGAAILHSTLWTLSHIKKKIT